MIDINDTINLVLFCIGRIHDANINVHKFLSNRCKSRIENFYDLLQLHGNGSLKLH